MVDDEDPVLTIVELSEYLKIPKSTLYKLVRSGSIPSIKVGKHWRFHRGAIDAWLANQNPGPNQDSGNENVPGKPDS